MRWEGNIARMDGTRSVHQLLVGKPEERRPQGLRRCGWDDKIKRNLWEIGIDGDLILLAQDRD